MTRLRLTPAGPIWPYTDAMLRADEPGTLFPAVLTDADRAAFGVITPAATEPLEHDPATERVEEAMPALVGNTWTQQWAIVDLTPEEQQAIIDANRPGPDWAAFKTGLLASPDVNAALASSVSTAPAAALALPAATMALTSGVYGDFRACWITLREVGGISDVLRDQVAALATSCNLPAEVLAIIGAKLRARNPDGTYRADDPATPDVDEAWV